MHSAGQVNPDNAARYYCAMNVCLKFRYLLLLLLLGSAGHSAAAQNLLDEQLIFEDRSSQMTLAQVKQAAFLPTGKIINRGYTRSALWVRLKVTAPAAEQRLMLRVFPAQLENLTLFSDQLDSRGKVLTERSTWIESAAGQNTYYIRIKTSGPMLIQLSVLSPEQAQQEEVSRGLILGAVLASYAPLLVWLLVLIVRRREWLHCAFLINFSIVVTTFLAWMGYLPELIGPAHWLSSSDAIHFLGVLNIFSGFLCVVMVLNRFGLPRWGRSLFLLLGGLYVCLVILFFFADRQLILQSCAFLGLIASLLGLPLTVLTFYRQKSSTWLISAVIFLAVSLGFRWFLTVFNLLAAVESIGGLLFFRLLFALSFIFATLTLIDREKQSQLKTSRINEVIARRLAESETQRREIQERFMTMLMHELKTPLAIIQLAANSLGRHLLPDSSDAKRVKNINRSVDDLNALVERCVSADQLDQGAMLIQKETLCLTRLAGEVLQTMDASRIDLYAPATLQVFTDAQYLRLILLNLLSNALKYSPPDSRVDLSLETLFVNQRQVVQLRICNSVGSAGQPDARHVFTRYYRAEGAKPQVGAGLGLWLSQTLARQLGTALSFEAEQHRVCFNFFLELN